MDRCRNFNHTKMNVTIRNCPDCGKVVNTRIPKANCTHENHAKRVKDRSNFCIDCGKDFKAGK